jgi:hypothetical protein
MQRSDGRRLDEIGFECIWCSEDTFIEGLYPEGVLQYSPGARVLPAHPGLVRFCETYPVRVPQSCGV